METGVQVVHVVPRPILKPDHTVTNSSLWCLLNAAGRLQEAVLRLTPKRGRLIGPEAARILAVQRCFWI